MRLTRTQGQKLQRMQNAVDNKIRTENDERASADLEAHLGHRGRAASKRKTADGIRRSRQKMEAEIADRKANPGKYRW